MITQPVERQASAKPLVLLVEDNKAIHQVLIDSLSSSCDIVSAFDGEDGLAKARDLLPDLVIADLGLPKLSGEEMIKAFRSEPELVEIPVLVVTGDADPMAMVRTLEQGAQDALRKPFVVQEVRARVEGLIQAKRTRDVLARLVGHKDMKLIQLAEAMAQKKKQLEASEEQARRANRIKGNFLRMMTHELKTPIASMQLHMHLLDKEEQQRFSSAGRRIFARMRRSNGRLLRLIDTSMEWARVESGRKKLKPQEFDIRDVLEETINTFRDVIHEKEIDIACHFPESVVICNDKSLVSLLAHNLLDYALQNASTHLELELLASPSQIQLRVMDGTKTGAHQGSLFESLEALDDPKTTAGPGSGLGLTVMRDLARALGGNLHVQVHKREYNAYVWTLPVFAERQGRAS